MSPKTSVFGLDPAAAYANLQKGIPSSDTFRKDRSSIPERSDLSDYILLEGKIHDSYSYPDILVKTTLAHPGKNWNEAHETLNGEGAFMLTLRMYVDFLNLFRKSEREGKPIYDGRGVELDGMVLTWCYNSLLYPRTQRSEWLDAKFGVRDVLTTGTWLIDYHIIGPDGTPQPHTEDLQGYVSSGLPEIKMDEWFERATMHGLPPRDIIAGKMKYISPRIDTATIFDSNGSQFTLSCGANQERKGSALMVRPALVKQ